MTQQHFPTHDDAPTMPGKAKTSLMPIIGFAVVILALLVVVMSHQKSNSGTQVRSDLYPEGTAGTAVKMTETPVVVANAHEEPTDAEIDAARKAGTRRATIKTVKGVIVAELYGKEAPLTVANFVKLAQSKFYDGLTFHRVESFCIQGGDPQGNGTGDAGYSIQLEIAPKLKHIEGALAMARSDDPNSAGSQFYITLTPAHYLDGNYAVFGKVLQGMDVAKKIAKGDKITSITIQ